MPSEEQLGRMWDASHPLTDEQMLAIGWGWWQAAVDWDDVHAAILDVLSREVPSNFRRSATRAMVLLLQSGVFGMGVAGPEPEAAAIHDDLSEASKRAIAAGLADAEAGRLHSFEEVFGEPQSGVPSAGVAGDNLGSRAFSVMRPWTSPPRSVSVVELADAEAELARVVAQGEALAAVLDDLRAAASSMPDAGLTDDDPRRAWWFDTLVPARDAAAAALAGYREGRDA